MRRIVLSIALLVALVSGAAAQGPGGKTFGFGLIIGEPLGGTVKFWTNKENAFTVSLGGSYFGSPRLQGDYLWHFDAFNSSVVKLYAGPGVGIGFGREGYGWINRRGRNYFYYRDDAGIGVAARAMFGLNIIPRKTPLEIFVEAGPNIGLIPNFGTAFDAAIGVRFYP